MRYCYKKPKRKVEKTEQEAKRLLLEQLDESLLSHAAALGQKAEGPSILDTYKLQGLSELHYYLKVEHEFTAAEVEALLSFADPLAVAQDCWEENGHEHSFPICELLNEINAYQRFPQKEAKRSESELIGTVISSMEQEFTEYRESVLRMSKEDIFSKGTEIAAMRDALDFIRDDYKFEPGDAETFLRMKKPLGFVADLWPTEIAFMFDMASTLFEALGTEREYQTEREAAAMEAVQSEKPSVRGQLRAAMKEARQHLPQEDKARGGEAR